MIIQGRVFKFGDDLDTDAILPGQYLSISNPEELAKHCMEGYQQDFPQKIKQGDIFVGGSNFGCGSSREHAPIAIKAAGVSCVIAKSFARIFYRNGINIGLPLFECAEAYEGIDEGDTVQINTNNGLIKNLTKGTQFQAMPLPDFIKDIIMSGGLVEYVKNKLKNSRRISL